MFKTRFILITAVLFVSLAVSNPLSNAPESTDFGWPSRRVIIPLAVVRSLDAYHKSEWTLTDPNAGLSIYLQNERTFVEPQAGMAIYQNSERTRVPLRFTKYQLSEWFGRS